MPFPWSLLFLIPSFAVASTLAFLIGLIELGVITWIRHCFMETPAVTAGIQLLAGGALVFITGVLIGQW